MLKYEFGTIVKGTNMARIVRTNQVRIRRPNLARIRHEYQKWAIYVRTKKNIEYSLLVGRREGSCCVEEQTHKRTNRQGRDIPGCDLFVQRQLTRRNRPKKESDNKLGLSALSPESNRSLCQKEEAKSVETSSVNNNKNNKTRTKTTTTTTTTTQQQQQ